jgi:hypothetical protein
MKEKQIKIPSPDHPISIERNPVRIVVSAAGRVIAETRNALTLRESDYSPVQYIPREDVDFAQLERTEHATYCPYKAIALTTAFPLEERSRSTRCGRTRIHIPLLRRSKDTSRSIPTESMKSRSNFQRRVSRQRAVVPNEWRKLL